MQNNVVCHPAARNASIYPKHQPPVIDVKKSSSDRPIESRKSSITPANSNATLRRRFFPLFSIYYGPPSSLGDLIIGSHMGPPLRTSAPRLEASLICL